MARVAMIQLVPGRPSARALTFWVRSSKRNAPGITLFGPKGPQTAVHSFPLGRAGDPACASLLHLVACTGLIPNHAYRLVAARDGESAEVWSRTLPEKLKLNEAFSVAFGSCFCVARNKGIERCFPPKVHEDDVDPIRFRVLAGDQIYMDAGTGGGFIFSSQPNPTERYLNQWSSPVYSQWLRQAPNLMLADDHEFWNDYPHKSVWLTWSDSNRHTPLARSMDRAFELFQAALNVDGESIDGQVTNRLGTLARSFLIAVDPLSFFFLDTRTERDRYDAREPHFCPPGQLQRLRKWAATLSGPGVLVVAQPLVERPASAFARFMHTMGDANLPDYNQDFSSVWSSLFSAPHDIVVLTGDIHYSRMYTITRQSSKSRVHEVVSSSLARISWPDTNADQTPNGKVEYGNTCGLWAKRYSDDPQGTYSVATFRPLSTGVQLHVRLWDVGKSGAVERQRTSVVLR